MASEDYQKAVADGIATKCIEEMKTSDSNEEENSEGCSETGTRAFHCAGKELINSCPNDKQDTADECVKFREFINRNNKGIGKRPSRAVGSK